MANSLSNMLVMVELELRRLKHDRTEIYTRIVQPILWLVIYGPIMSSVRGIPTGGIPYTDYITPGILVQSTTFTSILYGLTMVWESESGILKKLLVAPVPRYATVIGRSMAGGVRATFQALIIFPVALIIGVKFVHNIAYVIAALPIVFFVSGGFAATSIIVASFMKTRERFMGIGSAITFPLFFASSALYPIQMMPPILREFALFNPMSYAVDVIRALIITGDLTSVPIDIAAITLFDTIMFVAASLSFKRIIK